MNFDEQDELDARLRSALTGPLPDTHHLENSVRRRIGVERSRRAVAALAAVIVAVIAGYSTTVRRPPPRLFTDAFRDHHSEVTEHKPRHWRSSDAEIAALTTRFGLPSAALDAFSPVGYRLEHAKTCGLDGHPVLHLVFSNGTAEFSLYIQPRSASPLPARTQTLGTEQLAAIQTARFDSIIVTGGSSEDCLKLAKRFQATI